MVTGSASIRLGMILACLIDSRSEEQIEILKDSWIRPFAASAFAMKKTPPVNKETLLDYVCFHGISKTNHFDTFLLLKSDNVNIKDKFLFYGIAYSVWYSVNDV
ncbi:hypothetical protein CEXT_21611 [Caerostris extrusa]|uniref:Uncharacterized protein n=1 Tax=Caerostris extrusa TaxID=172846 RepID=A0AAV4NPP1_CAEEX|nr:hypothetical protein CEXT_21611 [Caerostris extrusa]